jgi:hypothetical protein
MVSIMSSAFAQRVGLPVKALDELIDLYGAGHNKLNYEGFVEATVQLPKPFNDNLYALFLVVPNDEYNTQVPIIVGTNILEVVQSSIDEDGSGVSLESFDSAWKLGVESLNCNLGAVKSTKSLVVPAHSKIVIHGFTHAKLRNSTSVLTEECFDKPLPGGLIVAPGYLKLSSGMTRVPVKVINLSDRDVTISPKSVLCELHEVTRLTPDASNLDEKSDQYATDDSVQSKSDSDSFSNDLEFPGAVPHGFMEGQSYS